MKNYERRVSFGGPFVNEKKFGKVTETVGFGGVLYLTKDPESFRAQLDPSSPQRLTPVEQLGLLDDVDTDQLIPVRHLLTDEVRLLGERVLRGLPEGFEVGEGTIRHAGALVLVAGERFGKGSSREQAVWALLGAGVGAVLAESFGPVFERNAASVGLLTSTHLELARQIQMGEPVPLQAFLEGKDGLLQKIILHGGLFGYLRALHEGREPYPSIEVQGQGEPMNIWEKRLARAFGVKGVRVGDVGILPVGLAASYVGLSGLAFQAIEREYGGPKLGIDAQRVLLFEDHFAHSVRPEIPGLTDNQRRSAQVLGMPEQNYYHGRANEGGGAGIIHRVLLERINPLIHQVIMVTDSHTPTLGALPILPIPVGSTFWGAAIAEGMLPYAVSSVMRVELTGNLPPGLSIRDVQLELAGTLKVDPTVRVVEFGGSGFKRLSFDQVAALCNMIPEVFNAETAVTESFEAGIAWLQSQWGIDRGLGETLYGEPESNASYAQVVTYNLKRAVPWIAKPGSPREAVSLANLKENPKIDRAFLVSCTLGLEDLAQAAAMLEGQQVSARLIVVPASKLILEQATAAGIIGILEQAGAKVVMESACGPCIGESLDSLRKGEVGITASNRNHPGRMGEGNVYMAGPPLTTLAALQGKIPTAQAFLSEIPRMVENYNRLKVRLGL